MEGKGRRSVRRGDGEAGNSLPPPPPRQRPSGSGGSLSPRLRRIAVVGVAAAVAVASAIALSRFDGLHATDAATGDSTRWFVDQTTRRLALIDGYSGTTLARLHPGTNKQRFDVIDGPAGAFVLYGRSSEARSIDGSSLELGQPTPIPELTATHKLTTVTRRGLTVIDADTGNGTLFDKSGVVTPFGSPPLDDPMMTPDGALWGLDGGDLIRVDGTDTTRTPLDSEDAEISLVGDKIIVLDRAGHRVRFGGGDWTDLPTPQLGVDGAELILQEPGPAADCGWVAGHDAMFCVSSKGIEHTVGLEMWVAAPERLAVSGRAAVVVSANPPGITQFDPSTGKVNTSSKASVPVEAQLAITTGDGLVWIEDVGGTLIWSANQWSLQSARKDDERAPLMGSTGETIETAEGTTKSTKTGDSNKTLDHREPDDNGIDDPPVAIDDVALVRSGASLPLVATANDFDPDGEAVVIESATAPSHGTSTIASATTISYQSEPGFVGDDTFEYTIVDGDGDPATASITIRVVGPDHKNEPPVALNDWSETVAGVPVVLDVLANDYDPERDALEIKSETQPQIQAQFRRVVGASGLEAIEVTPDPSIAENTDLTFTYKAQDAYGAVSDVGTVTISVRPADAKNLPPVLEADAVRAQRLTPVSVPVLANDRDPDGDRLRISELKVPATLNARIDGNQIVVNAREAARDLETFSYTVDDGNGHTVKSTVLVLVEPAAGANRPPVAVPDIFTAVAGQRTSVNPLNNDYDPDGDDINIVSLGDFRSDDVPGVTVELVDDGVMLSVPAWASDGKGTGSFEYEITDGKGHTVATTVTMSIFPKALESPPTAVDDAADTQRNEPVLIDVLKNDSELSGQEPTIVGNPTCADGGKAETKTGGRVLFTPPTDEIGTFKCTYRISNPQGLTASAVITVTVIDDSLANRPPEPINDDAIASPGQRIVIKPLKNDNDPDGDPLTLDAVESPRLGSARKKGRTVVFTAPEQAGIVTFAYQVSDDNGGVSKGQISVNVVAEKTPSRLIARDDSGSIDLPGKGYFAMDVLANDQSPNSDSLTLDSVELVRGPGKVSLSGDKVSFSFKGQPGTIFARYTAKSSDGQTSSAVAALTLLKTNTPPTAGPVSKQLAPGDQAVVRLEVQDDDRSGLSVTVSPSTVGGVTASPNGTKVRLAALPSATGGTFRYVVTDAHGASAESTITVTISNRPEPPPQPPTTPPPCTDEVNAPAITANTPMAKSVDIFSGAAVVGEVVEIGDPKPADGGTIDRRAAMFTPSAKQSGPVTFDYKVRNGCAEATGTVTVNVNFAPIPTNITVTVDGNATEFAGIESFAADQEHLTIESVQPDLNSLQGISVNNEKTSIKIEGVKLTKEKTTLKVTVVDPGFKRATAEITIVWKKPPPPDDTDDDIGRDFAVTVSTHTATVVLGSKNWELTDVVTTNNAKGKFAATNANSEERAALRFAKGTADGTVGKFQYTITNKNGDTRLGTVTVKFQKEKPTTTSSTTTTSTTTTTAPRRTTTTIGNTTSSTEAPPPTTAPSTTTKPPAKTTTTTTTTEPTSTTEGSVPVGDK